MARGRKTSFTIRLTPAQHQTLLAWQRARNVPAGLARHGRIILLLADGMTITDTAAAVGMSRRHVYKWGYPLKAGHPLEGSFYEGLSVKRF